MPIYKKDQSLPEQPVIVLIYADPGTGKTSLGNTCATPLNIDFDRGFKRSVGRPDVLMPSNWKEVEDELTSGTFDNYSTIVPDTAKGALDDFLMAHVKAKYPTTKDPRKYYGYLGDEFKLFVNQLRLKNKDIFLIAHAKDQEDGDTIRKIPDVTGQSSALLLRIADQVGYLTIRNGKRTITFNPTENSIGKNVAQLPDIILPLHTSPEWTGFADREIICKVKEALTTMSEEQREALGFIESWREKIDQILPLEEADKTDELLKGISKAVAEITPEHMKKQVQAYLVGHLAKIGWKWNGAEKVFKSVNPPAEANTSPVSEDKPVADEIDLVKDAEAQRAALAPKEDLFASSAK